MRFLNLKAVLDPTLTLLTTTGAIVVAAWDQSRSGQNLQAASLSWQRALPTKSREELYCCILIRE